MLLHGIPEKKQENTDELCIKAINEHLDLDINDRDIDRTHRIGNPRNADEKPRPIIIKLVRYNDRKKIFDSKKKLKGKKIAITESLTVTRMKKLNEARERYNFKNVWTSDGKILIQWWVGENLVVNGHVLYYRGKNRFLYCRSVICSRGYFHLG